MFDGEKEEVSLLWGSEKKKKTILCCLPAAVFVFSLRMICCGGIVMRMVGGRFRVFEKVRFFLCILGSNWGWLTSGI